jgi:hypothetical protein
MKKDKSWQKKGLEQPRGYKWIFRNERTWNKEGIKEITEVEIILKRKSLEKVGPRPGGGAKTKITNQEMKEGNPRIEKKRWNDRKPK